LRKLVAAATCCIGWCNKPQFASSPQSCCRLCSTGPDRVLAGVCPANIEESMKAEHCTLGGSLHPFSPRPKSTTCPKREWEIVMGLKSISEEDRRRGRAIPNLDELLELEMARKSRLVREEVVAVVLYTGPMVSGFFRMTQ
jgi:hypothetical protein